MSSRKTTELPVEARIRYTLGRMPYLPAATHTIPKREEVNLESLADLLEELADFLGGHADEVMALEAKLQQHEGDIAAVRRVFGIPALDTHEFERETSRLIGVTQTHYRRMIEQVDEPDVRAQRGNGHSLGYTTGLVQGRIDALRLLGRNAEADQLTRGLDGIGARTRRSAWRGGIGATPDGAVPEAAPPAPTGTGEKEHHD